VNIQPCRFGGIFTELPESDTVDRNFPNDTPLIETDLPARLQHALSAEGIRTVGDVRNLSDLDLRCIRRVGNQSFRLLRKMFGPSRKA
jgi:DNA-directed RNA polymerase alpha subunit